MRTNLQAIAQARIDEAVRTLETYAPLAPYVAIGESEDEKLRAAAVNAMLARANIAPRRELLGNPFADHSAVQLARWCSERGGVDVTGRSDWEVVGQGFANTTSDFPNLLADVARKAMLRGFDASGETYPLWTVPGTLFDFKPTARAGLDSFPALDPVGDGSSFKHGTMGDRKETATLATYGKIFSVSRQAVIEDDLGAFTRLPMAAGRAAARTAGDLAYAALTGNPTMGDAIALFHASHSNLASPGTAITTAAVDAIRASMAGQVNNGIVTGIRLYALLVPLALEGTARAVANGQFFVGEGGALDAGRANTAQGTFEVIADHRLDVASPGAWYAVADPERFDTVELAYLGGDSQPRLDTQSGFSQDGMKFKITFDVAATPLEYRTLAKNPGS